MILCYEKYIYNWVANDTMLWEIYLYLSRWWYYVVWNIFIIESLTILCCEKYIHNWVADDIMLWEIYL